MTDKGKNKTAAVGTATAGDGHRQGKPASTPNSNFNPVEWQAELTRHLNSLPDPELARTIKRAADAAFREKLQAEGQPDGATWEDLASVVGSIEWDWNGWLARGLPTVAAGEPGTGKSALALRIAATYIKGLPWPDGSLYSGERGAVLWCEAEAGQAIHLERARAWKLPLKKLLTPLSESQTDIYLDDPAHQAAISHMARRADVRLIVVDSLSGANRGEENSADMREVGKWIAELARDVHKPVLVTHHLRKRGLLDGRDKVALDRLRGSTTIAQFARVVWAIDTPNPAEEDHRRLSVIKSNLAKIPAALGLRVAEQGVTFDAAPTMPKNETLQDKAADLLFSLLATGPMDADSVRAEVEAAGLSWHAATRAKEKIGIVSSRARGKWSWGLPAKGNLQ
jgi:hypothetical protein